MGKVTERVGLALFRLALLLQPRWLRRRVADEMVSVFRERHGRARGVRGILRAWGIELAGALIVAVRARLPDLARETPRPGRSLMDSLAQDVRFGLRAIVRRPLHASLAVLTLGLGIATSTAMFSVVDAVLLRPLPYPAPERIVSVYPTNPSMQGHPTLGDAAERGTFSYPEFADLRDNLGGALESVAILAWSGGILARDDGPAERVPMAATSAALFTDVLKVEPLRGSLFTEEQERTEAAVLLITEGFWERRFGRDPGVVGTVVDIGGAHEVIGVLPASFELSGWDVDAWRLMPAGTNRGNHSFYAVGRLAPGVGAEAAASSLTAAFRAVAPEDVGHEKHAINVFGRQTDETRRVRGPLLLLAGAALVLLLVACGNVAVLMLGAALDREHELAVRGALGAGRGRLAQQLLTESVVLAGAASALGIGLASLALRALVFLAPGGVPHIEAAAVDARALGVAVVVAGACGILFGLAPALLFSRTDGQGAMGGTRAGSRRGRARIQGLVVTGELALATVLLVGAGLLGRTVLALGSVDPGYAIDELVTVRMSIPLERMLAGMEDVQRQEAAVLSFYDDLRSEIEALPGVAGAAYTSNVPLSGDRSNNDLNPEGYQGEPIIAERRFVSHDYFDVMGIDIVEGRAFDPSDDQVDAAGTMVISEGVARLAFGEGSAIGKQITYWGRPATVVGVARNIRDEAVDRGTDLAFYVPRRQSGQYHGQLVVRAGGDPVALVPALRRRIQELDPGVAILSVQPMAANLDSEIAAERYRARLVIVFSALATLFALMGIYGVTARGVASRTRELGIRKALGAEGQSVLGLVLRQGVRLAVWGGALGFLLAWAGSRLVASYLYGVGSSDPVTILGTAVVLGAASMLAALAPGLRAARVDPVEALRAD